MLVYLIGASGVGKDSLLDAVRKRRPDLLVAHRYITRPSGVGEDSVALSPAEFEARRARGLFCLDWVAHGLHYGVGIEVEAWLTAGATVLLNGSRRELASARARFGERLKPVVVTAPPEVLCERLARRGRESDDQIEARLARHAEVEAELERCHPALDRVDNGGSLDESVRALEAIIASRL